MLKVKDLDLHLGGLKILNNLSFEVKDASITGLIGPNGAGKSSFYNALFGLFPLKKGSIKFQKKRSSGYLKIYLPLRWK